MCLGLLCRFSHAFGKLSRQMFELTKLHVPEYVAVGTWSAEMSGRYPGVMISINKLSVRVSPICLSELVAILAEVGKNGVFS